MIRDLEQSDIPRLQELFSSQGFECNAPDWSKLKGQALVDADGVIRMVLADRPTVEEYMLIDKGNWATPGMKFELFQELHEAERVSLQQRGIEDCHIFVPPCARSFAHKLKKFLGWVNSLGPNGDWIALTRDV